jgi:hypothetical protein
MVIAAWHNSRIKRLDLATGVFFALPVGQRGHPAAHIALADDGNLFLADTDNQRIRRIGIDAARALREDGPMPRCATCHTPPPAGAAISSALTRKRRCR